MDTVNIFYKDVESINDCNFCVQINKRDIAYFHYVTKDVISNTLNLYGLLPENTVAVFKLKSKCQ